MGIRTALARLIGMEDRAGGNYTDQVMYNQYTLARGNDADALVTACSNAARITALTMARGQVNLDGMMSDYWQGVVTDDWMFQAAYDALMYGNAVYLIDAGDMAAGILGRSGAFEVLGKRRPYRYRLEVMHPDGQETRAVSETEVLHLRIGADRTAPWRGRSVFHDVLLRCIDKGLVDMARLPSQRIVNYPRNRGSGIEDMNEDGADYTDDVWHSFLSRAGLINLVDNSGPRGTPMEIPSKDLTFRPDQQAVELRRDLVKECFAAVGYPPAMLSGETPGQTVRQEYTRWVVGVLQPMADILAGQIAAALEVTCSWDMTRARIPLLTDQAVAFKNLTGEHGLAAQEALRIAGLS